MPAVVEYHRSTKGDDTDDTTASCYHLLFEYGLLTVARLLVGFALISGMISGRSFFYGRRIMTAADMEDTNDNQGREAYAV